MKRFVCVLLILACFSVFHVEAAQPNASVKLAQKHLKILGYEPGQADGLWGKKTVEAVKSFQRDSGLDVTGKLNDDTIQQLQIQVLIGIPATTIRKSSDSQSTGQTLGVSFNQLMKYLSDYFVMKKGEPLDGQDRYNGLTADGTASLEIIGDKKNISYASIIAGIPKDAKAISQRNGLLAARFLINAVPEWKGGMKWLTESLQKLTSSEETTQKIVQGHKEIAVSWYDTKGMYVVSVKPVTDDSVPVTEVQTGAETPSHAQATGQTLGVSYEQAMEFLSKYFTMDKGTPAEGQPKYWSMTTDKTASLEIIGDKRNISQTSMMVDVTADDEIVQRNGFLALRLALNVVPEWTDCVKWMTDTIGELASSQDLSASKTIIQGNKVIKVSLLKKMGLMVVAITPNSGSSSQVSDTQQNRPQSTGQTLGVSYDQIMQYLSGEFSVEKGTFIDGRDTYVGTSTDETVILEIIGDKRDVFQASIMADVSSELAQKNGVFVASFLKTSVPEWKGSVDWLIETLQELVASETASNKKIHRGNKAIEVSLHKQASLLIVKITGKNQPERQIDPENSDMLTKMEVVFKGGYARYQIKSLVDKVMHLYDMPLTEKNYNVVGSVMLALRENTDVEEMAMLVFMINAYNPNVKTQFNSMAALAATMLAPKDK